MLIEAGGWVRRIDGMSVFVCFRVYIWVSGSLWSWERENMQNPNVNSRGGLTSSSC